MKPATIRKNLIKVIGTNVRYLRKLGTDSAFSRLEIVLEATGFLENRRTSTCDRTAAAIVALSTMNDIETLIDTAHSAVFYRHFDGDNRKPGDYERADELADNAIRSCGVAFSNCGEADWIDVVAKAVKRTRQEARAA